MKEGSIESLPSETESPTHTHTFDTEAGEEYAKVGNEDEPETISIPNDIYSLWFVAEFGGQAFFYSIYIFMLKIVLFTFLALDAANDDNLVQNNDPKVLITQILMVPVAVAMQTDLIDSYYMIANARYDEAIQKDIPCATRLKYTVSTMARWCDGAFSLIVNYLVLLAADSVLGLFLNFAALHFLQDIDNLGLTMAKNGFITDRMEEEAAKAETVRLRKRHASVRYWRSLDTILFLSTVLVLSVTWAAFYLKNKKLA